MVSSADDGIVVDLGAAFNALGVRARHRPGTYELPRVGSRFWSTLLRRWCGKDSRSKRLPPFWPSLSNKALAQLLRAYFTADGGVDGVQIRLRTASERLASTSRTRYCGSG